MIFGLASELVLFACVVAAVASYIIGGMMIEVLKAEEENSVLPFDRHYLEDWGD